MLCSSCQNKPHCLAAQLAEGDAALVQLLGQLRRCSLKTPRRNLRQRLQAGWQLLQALFYKAVWSRLRPR